MNDSYVKTKTHHNDGELFPTMESLIIVLSRISCNFITVFVFEPFTCLSAVHISTCTHANMCHQYSYIFEYASLSRLFQIDLNYSILLAPEDNICVLVQLFNSRVDFSIK